MDLRGLVKIWILILLTCSVSIAQQDQAMCIYPAFQEEVDRYLSYDVPIISVADAYERREDVVFLDAREAEEYKISHVKDALNVGYDDFELSVVSELPKDQSIVIYCSIGYRSEKIGKKLKDAGYTNVKNMYGSLFEWVNQHHPIVDQNGKETNQIHTYNKVWSRWVTTNDVDKVW